MCYKMMQHIIQKKDAYVTKMMKVNTSRTHWVVYMDKSYVHKRYSSHEDSMFDPDDKHDLQVKAQHKG